MPTDAAVAGGSTGAASAPPSGSASATPESTPSPTRAPGASPARVQLPSLSIERLLLFVAVPLLALTAVAMWSLFSTPKGRHSRP